MRLRRLIAVAVVATVGVTGLVAASRRRATIPPLADSPGTLSAISSMLEARAVHSSTLQPDGRVLIAGGLPNGSIATAELYDPAEGTFLPTGRMNTSRAEHSATLLADGKVLIAGGLNTDFLASTELYVVGSYIHHIMHHQDSRITSPPAAWAE